MHRISPLMQVVVGNEHEVASDEKNEDLLQSIQRGDPGTSVEGAPL